MRSGKWQVRAMAVLAVLAAFGSAAWAGDTVQPASAAVTNIRNEAEGYITPAITYAQGTTVLLTNCVAYSGSSTSSAVQGLSGVTITVDVGNTTSNLSYSGTAISTNGGTWWVSLPVPTWMDNPSIQVKLTDSLTNIYIYPLKLIKTRTSL